MKDDDHRLFEIRDHLISKHNIPAENIKLDYFLVIDVSSGNYYHTQYLAEEPKNSIIHRPDIMIFEENKLKLIIEDDGMAHRTRRPLAKCRCSGRCKIFCKWQITKKTRKRNDDYHTIKVPCIILDYVDLKILEKDKLQFLDENLPSA